jgi:cell division protein FtsN
MSEEGFHEIQLNGKQLVFLFITVTVVSVVIFLCGVLVGRNVRPERASAAADSSVAPVPDSPAPGQAAPSAPPAAADSRAAAAGGDLTYTRRLEAEKAPVEILKPEQPSPRPPAPPAATAPPAQAATSAQQGAASTAEPAGEGYAVQIAALRDGTEAEAIVKRLIGKGYRAYVLQPAAGGAAAVYRVRVGKYKSRREADDIAARLEKEEQFRPWVIR